MLVKDRLTIHDKHRTTDGYLVTEARFARSGIYEYAGRDVGKPEMETVRVYRPEDEVFSADAMASFAHKPITNDHPADNVNASTWKRDAVGFTDGRVARDGDFVVIPMMVADAAAIDDVDGGKVELSAGYTCDMEFIDGATDDGSQYDAVMRNIRGNHIALVDKGRAGSECRVGDSFERPQENTMQLKKVIVDGFEVETTDAGATAIATLQDKLAAEIKARTDAAAAHATALAAKDTELAAKDTEIEKLQGQVLDAAALDKRVADRAVLVNNASKLVADFDAKGKTDAEIKRAVVQAKCGDAAVTDRSDAYIDARFDGLLETLGEGGTDTVRDALLGGGGGNGSTAKVVGYDLSVNDAQREERAAFAESINFNQKPVAAKAA